MIDRTLHSANLLVAMAGLVSAPGIADAIGAAVSGALSARDLAKSLPAEARPLVEEIHTLLTRALTNAHLSESARTLIPQMLELSVPDADTIIKAGKDPARILTAMEATLDQKGDPAHAPPALRQCFRDTLTPALQRLMQDGDVAEALKAAFQGEVFRRFDAQDAQHEKTHAMLRQVQQLLESSGLEGKLQDVGITEQAIVNLAGRITEEVKDLEQAWTEIQTAVQRWIAVQEEGSSSSNHMEFVDQVLRHVAELSQSGQHKQAGEEIAAALANDKLEYEARAGRMLKTAVDVALLDRDAETAASHLIARADLEAGGRAGFEGLRTLQDEWCERGRVQGSRLDLQVSVALGKQVLGRATGSDERGTALNNLAITLAELGNQSGDADLLDQAVAAFGQVLKEWPRDRVPLEWAMTQNNLGNALKSLGDRRGDTDLLDQAVAAYGEALKEWPRDRVPLHWAGTQNNLGAALQSLGDRRGDADLLDQAVAAYGEALKERTRDRVPLDWATTQNNLGNALGALGELKGDTDLLDQAVSAFGQALKERTRDRVPLDWAGTHGNLARVETARFDLTQDPSHLDVAQEYLDAARQVFEAHGADGYLQAIANNQAMIDARRG